MYGPPLVAWLLVVTSAVAAGLCLLRGGARDEALTGAGMAVMAVPMSVLDPRPWAAPVLAAVFGAATLHAVLRRRTHRLHHVVCSAAMVYMALVMPGGGPAGGHVAHGGMAHASPGVPPATGLLMLYFAAYVLRAGAGVVSAPALSPAARPGAAPPAACCAIPAVPAPTSPTASPSGSAGNPAGPVQLLRAPELAVACRVSMALAMVAMLMTL